MEGVIKSCSHLPDLTLNDPIFWGTRKKISEDEIYPYHKSVDVYWQQNAWADTTVCLNWEKKTIAPPMKDKQGFILFCDNLKGQQTALLFHEEVRQSGGII